MTTLYLVWHERPFETTGAGSILWDGDARPLNDNMWLVRSSATRSGLYHATKRQLPKGSALMVAPLEDLPSGWPKFKGMRAGALAWLRQDSRGDS
jgi:hypothetical protein